MNNIEWALTSDEVLTITGKGRLDEDFEWLKDCPCTKIIIGEGITEIGRSAFFNLYCIEEVVLPDSLVTINPSAFESCEGLKHINFPDGLKHIEYYAFGRCFDLTSIVVSKDTEISGSAFCLGVKINYK